MMTHEHDDGLRALKLDDLREAWRTRFGDRPPLFRSRDLLLRAFVHRLEIAEHGDCKPSLKKRLTDLSERFAADPNFNPEPRIAPSVGSALVRDWNGVRHIVLVTHDGFPYLDRTYSSLTQVAKAISGTHQSGPRFFGLVGGVEKRVSA